MGKTSPGLRAGGTLALLLGLNLLCYLDRYILAAVEPAIRSAFFAPDDPSAMAKTGALATVFLLSYLASAPLFGWLADRMSRWRLIGLGVIVWSAASMGSGLAPVFAVLLLMRALVGVGEAAYGPSAPTIIWDVFSERRRGIALAWFFAAIPVGSALGYVFGGSVSAAFGWRWPFHLAAWPGFLLGLICLFLKDPSASGPPRRKADWHDYRALLHIPSLRLNTAGQTAMTFAIGGMSFWAPAYFSGTRGLGGLERVNLIFGGITVVAGLLSTLFGGWLAERLRGRVKGAYFAVSATGMLIAFPCTILMLILPAPWVWVMCFLAIFFHFFNIGPSNTAIAHVTTPGVRASAYALNIFTIHALGDALSPPLMGAIADRWNLTAGFLLVSGAMLVAAVCWLLGIRHLDADIRAAGQDSA